MRTTLEFDIGGVRRLIDHAQASKQWWQVYDFCDAPRCPALILVHDQGVYLMSNGIPRLPSDKGGNVVVYADGYDPDKVDDWWQASCDAVGGDDFAEYLVLEADGILPVPDDAVAFWVEVEEETLRLGWVHEVAS